ncbi:DNA topoisomerase III, partial [Shewanella sp. 0m-11]
LINSLPQSATTPDMTALWENNLDAISRKEAKYQNFMDPLVSSLQGLIEQAGSQLPTSLQGVKSPDSGFKKRRYSAKKPATSKSSAVRKTPTKKTSTSKRAPASK